MIRNYILALAVCSSALTYGQVYNFTNCGATGRTGPTQTQVNTAYTSTNLAGLVTSNGGIQRFVVPIGGSWRVTATGASGGTSWASAGGQGISISCEVNLTGGDTLNIVVGQEGQWNGTSSNYNGGSGGGGSFVYTGAIGGGGLIIAAGGGGGGQSSVTNADPNNADANYWTSGDTITIRSWMSPGGVNGNGGHWSTRGIHSGGPGAGWLSNANTANNTPNSQNGGTRFVGGTAFPTPIGRDGGFGGGGAAGNVGTGNYAWAGGGGGYSGGGAGGNGGNSDGQMGGGGGSFLTGTNQTNIGFNTGMGGVTLQLLCTPNTGSQTLSICYGDTVWVGNNAHASSGTFVDTIPGSTCDSIVTTNLTVSSPINSTVTLVAWPLQLVVSETGATYQWLDCDNNMAVIPGATGQTFNPTANGNYAVAVTVGSCTDTSACESVTTVGISEYALVGVSITPNPSNGLFQLSLPAGEYFESLEVYDLSGRRVWVSSDPRNATQIDLTEMADGLYLLQAQMNGQKKTFRIVKK